MKFVTGAVEDGTPDWSSALVSDFCLGKSPTMVFLRLHEIRLDREKKLWMDGGSRPCGLDWYY